MDFTAVLLQAKIISVSPRLLTPMVYNFYASLYEIKS